MATLVINKRSTSVKLESDHLLVHHHETDGASTAESKTCVPLAEVERVVIMGQPAISFPVLVRLMDKGIPCSFLSENGRWRGGLGLSDGYFAARKMRQYAAVQNPSFCLRVSQSLIVAKIANARRVIQRLLSNRNMEETSDVKYHRKHLDCLLQEVRQADSVSVLRGVEGVAAAHYFALLGYFFPETMPFTGRNRRPPKDEANALLSWTYSILLEEVIGCVRSHGLDVSAGVLHCNADRSPSLALDLIEPLRTGCCDLLVLNLVNHKIIRSGMHFSRNLDNDGVILNEEGRRVFFRAYEQAMRRKFFLPEVGKHVDMRQVIDWQVCAFLKTLEQGVDVKFFSLP